MHGRLIRESALALICFVLVCAPAHAEKRLALVIGNSAYRHVPTLINPANDADDVASALVRLGFSATKVENADYYTMRRALLEFGRRARTAEMAVVFFAGHGMEVGGENYLISVDAELRNDIDADNEAIGLKSVMLTVANASSLGLVILDACRNNPFTGRMERTVRTRSVDRGLVRVEPTGSVLVAYASRDGTTAADGLERNSPFTAALLRHIETRGLEINFLFRRVRDDVLAATGRGQEPYTYGALSGQPIYLTAAAKASPGLPPAPPPVAISPATTPPHLLKQPGPTGATGLTEAEIVSNVEALVRGPRNRLSLDHQSGDSWINQLAFAPDGRRLASASKDKMVRLWDVTTGTARATLQGHSAAVASVAFSPDGKRLASASWDSTVRLWDGQTGAPIAVLPGHANGVVSVIFSPDGRRLASASWDNMVRLWDGVTGVPVATLRGHTDFVHSIAFSPDGKLLASGGADNTLRLWDPEIGTFISILKGHTGSVKSVAFSPDGKRMASASSDKTVRLWDGRTRTLVTTLHGHTADVGIVMFSPDGKRLASGSNDKSARLWDASTGASISVLAASRHKGGIAACANLSTAPACAAAIGRLEGHIGNVEILVFSPDGKWLASGSTQELAVRLWDGVTGAPVAVIPAHTHKVTDIAFSADGRRLASAGCRRYVVTGVFHCAQVDLFLWSAANVPSAGRQ